MTTRTVSILGGDWSNVLSWAGGVVPLVNDDVVLASTSGSLNIQTSTPVIASFVEQAGYVGTVSGASNLNIGGASVTALTLVAGSGWTHSGTISCRPAASTTLSITSAGKTFNSMSVTSGTGTTKFLDALSVSGGLAGAVAGHTYDLNGQSVTVTGSLTLTAGTLTTNNATMSLGRFISTGSTARTINLGTSAITVLLGTTASPSVAWSGSNLTKTGTASWTLSSPNQPNIDVQSGVTLFDVTMNSTGNCTIVQAMTFTGRFTLTKGTLTITGMNVSVAEMVSTGTNTRTFNYNSGTLTVTGSGANAFLFSGSGLTAPNAFGLSFTGATPTLASNIALLSTVAIAPATVLTTSGGLTLAQAGVSVGVWLTMGAGSELWIAAGTTMSFAAVGATAGTTASMVGTLASPAKIRSTTAGVQATLAFGSGTVVTATSVDVKDNLITVTPTPQRDTGGIDSGNTTNWAFDFIVTVADSIGITDSPTVALDVTVADSIGLTDAAAAAVGVTVGDSIGVTDATSVALVHTVADAIGVTDGLSVALAVMVVDSVGLTDGAAVELGHTVGDLIGLSDTAGASALDVTVADTIGVVDGVATGLDHVVGDSIGLVDGVVVGLDVTIADSLGIADSVVVALGVVIADLIGIVDEATPDVVVVIGLAGCVVLTISAPFASLSFDAPSATVTFTAPTASIGFEECP